MPSCRVHLRWGAASMSPSPHHAPKATSARSPSYAPAPRSAGNVRRRAGRRSGLAAGHRPDGHALVTPRSLLVCSWSGATARNARRRTHLRHLRHLRTALSRCAQRRNAQHPTTQRDLWTALLLLPTALPDHFLPSEHWCRGSAVHCHGQTLGPLTSRHHGQASADPSPQG